LVSRFKFSPGAALQAAVDQQLSALDQKQQQQEERQAAVARGIFQLACYHVTLQPIQGMPLIAKPRK
jgi:hypothetical protein